MVELPNYDEKFWINKGKRYSNIRRYEEAIECYNKAIEINPYDENIWCNKGDCLTNLKRYEEAIKCYDMVITLNPSNEKALGEKGYVLYALGRNEEARKFYSKLKIEKIEHSDTMKESFQRYSDIMKDHDINDDDKILEIYSKENYEYGDYEYENDSD